VLSSATLRLQSRVASPVGLSVCGKMAEGVTLALLLTLLPRTLGASGYGRFAIALSLVQIAGASLALGGPAMLARFVPAAAGAERAAVARAMVGRMALWRLAGVSAAAGAGAVAALVAPDRFTPSLVAIVVGAIALDSAATLLAQAGLALGRTVLWSFRWPVQNAALLIAALALAGPFGVTGALAAIPIASACAVALGVWLAARPIVGAAAGAAMPEGALRFGATLVGNGVLAMITARGGVVAVVLLNGSHSEAGFAGLAIGVALAGVYAISQLFTVQLPALSARAAADPAGAEERARLLARAMTLLIAPATVALALGMEWIVPSLVGREFRDAAPAFVVALALLPFAPLAAVAGQAADLRLRPGIRLRASAASAAVFVAVALIAVPEWGAVGAAAALLAGTLANVTLLARLVGGYVGPKLPVIAAAGSGLTLLVGALA
jgi:O-antigen/teichoic acid export membrane protein